MFGFICRGGGVLMVVAVVILIKLFIHILHLFNVLVS